MTLPRIGTMLRGITLGKHYQVGISRAVYTGGRRGLQLSSPARNSGEDLVRSQEVGARTETQDITKMDELLRISRTCSEFQI